MAHVMKIKSRSVSALVDHYERARPGTLDRSNIDRDRTHLNYNLAPSDVKGDVRLAMAQHEQTAGRAVRSDANVLLDWVVTMPKDCPPERAGEFFGAVVDFMRGRYGAGNVLGGYVHLDETTPHIHVPVLPMVDGRLQASRMVTRADLRSFHGDLGDYVEGRLGLRVSVELDEEQRGEKQLSRLNQRDYIAAKKRLEAMAGEMESLAAERDEARSEALEARSEAREARSEAREARSEAIQARKEAEGLRKEIEGLTGALEALSARFNDLLRQVVEIADTMRNRKFVGGWRDSLARLRDNPIAREAVEAGKPWERERDARRADKAIEREVKGARRDLESIAAEVRGASREASQTRASSGREERERLR